jgi:hypothetical protein
VTLLDLVARTPAPGCLACAEKLIHTREEWRKFHPLAGHGCSDGRWTFQTPAPIEVVHVVKEPHAE